MLINMGRQLRKVPKNWEHPKDKNGKYIPMYNIYYGDVLKEWLENHEKWEKDAHPDLIKNPALKENYSFYAMWEPFPDPNHYLTKKYTENELTHIQLYETTSEGTPISPVFLKEKFDTLCEYAATYLTVFADFKVTKDEWKAMLSNVCDTTEPFIQIKK